MNKVADAVVMETLVRQIGPLLHGHDEAVQSAVIADLLAIWLAGHHARTTAATDRYREELLTEHIGLVRRLIPVNEKILRDRRA